MKVDHWMQLVIGVIFGYAVPTEATMCYPDHPQTAFCRSHFAIQAKVLSRSPMVPKSALTTASPTTSFADTGKHITTTTLKIKAKTGNKASSRTHKLATSVPYVSRKGAFVVGDEYVAVAGPSASDDTYKAGYLDMYKLPTPEIVRVQLLRIFKGALPLNASQYQQIDLNIQNPWHPDLKVSGIYLITGFVFPELPHPVVSMCNWNALWDNVTLVQQWGLKMYYEKSCKCSISFCIFGDICHPDQDGCLWEVPGHEIGSARSDCKSKKGICMNRGSKCEWYIPSLACTEPVWP